MLANISGAVEITGGSISRKSIGKGVSRTELDRSGISWVRKARLHTKHKGKPVNKSV